MKESPKVDFVFQIVLAVGLTFGLSSVSHASSFKASLVNCNDGDTCEFKRENGKTLKARFSGIDAPEKGKPFAGEARRFAMSFFSRGEVILTCNGMSFKRHVCEASVGGADFGEALISQGLAWDAPKFSNGRYKRFQDQAMQEKKGLRNFRKLWMVEKRNIAA